MKRVSIRTKIGQSQYREDAVIDFYGVTVLQDGVVRSDFDTSKGHAEQPAAKIVKGDVSEDMAKAILHELERGIGRGVIDGKTWLVDN